jgi:hypothetical protein
MPALALGSAKVRQEQLQKLPTTARPKIDARDVEVPEGYSVGVANDIGLALGISEITELTLRITNEKFVQHYRLQELVLELATISVLYRSEI